MIIVNMHGIAYRWVGGLIRQLADEGFCETPELAGKILPGSNFDPNHSQPRRGDIMIAGSGGGNLI